MKNNRIWVLDPIDGTKGFMRGEHYCIALALLVNGKPSLSVMGCPNLQLQQVLKGVGSNDINKIATGFDTNKYIKESSTNLHLFPTTSGSIFFAVSGHGSFARSLSMPLGAAYEVFVSQTSKSSDCVLCEAAEALHGDRTVTMKVWKSLGLSRDFVRLDGQCKLSIVGAGAADGNMRLPPKGYREKIWDHAAGSHYVTEAGGKVTDLQGRSLDFTEGRYLASDVTAILASNGILHKEILDAIINAKNE
jgi:HAL2 family 3'(2'),5'-bisphosphate nucleotidase